MAKEQNGDEKPKLKRKQYEKGMRRLQAELCHLQEWVKAEGRRIMIVFEGRDGAGKGGTIKAITERVSRRGAARSVGPSEVAAIHPALYGAFSSGGGDHHF